MCRSAAVAELSSQGACRRRRRRDAPSTAAHVTSRPPAVASTAMISTSVPHDAAAWWQTILIGSCANINGGATSAHQASAMP